MNTKKYTHAIGGRELTVEITDWAEQAHGSVLVRMGDTIVLTTAVMSASPREGGDFFPLSVEYEEKFYAAGKVLGSRFVKRETRPSEEAILAARLIDRAIRPRFDMRMRNEVQIVATTLSLDDKNDPDVLAMLGASLALSLSDIPWQGPIAGVRVARKDNALILNPSFEERLNAELDLVIAGTRERINMCEAGAREIGEDAFSDAADKGFAAIKDLIAFQESIIREHAKPKRAVRLLTIPDELNQTLAREFSARIEDAVYQKDKAAMRASVDELKTEWLARAAETLPGAFQKNAAEFTFDEEIDAIVHRRIIEKNERPDGRAPDEIRALSAAIAVLPRVHGSGLFMRGSTHVLSTLTLGAPGDQQIVEGMEIRAKRHFLHHYNFPPFSVGEVKPMRGPGRREIGHGALAGRAIMPLLPPQSEFPYTIRIVSEVLSSNGSSSMGSVSAASLALMDGGVPIKKLVSGAAMGLMLNEKGGYRVLTDIQGPEDHHGDMDFKVAGTRDGITAVQMDVKIEGVTLEMVKETLHAARSARMKILDVMESAISSPRENLSPWAPRITTLKINPEKIGALIGPGGKVINDIIARTGVAIDIEDDGTVFVTSEKEEGMAQAIEEIRQITRELKAGDMVEGRVTRLLDFGAFVEVAPRQEGLIHISELAPWHVEQVTDIVEIGDRVPAMVKNIDEQGRINLSLKDVPGRYSEEEVARGSAEREQMGPRPPRPHMRPHGGSRFGRPRGR
ncbi:MAG: polyribonucleotide nucleotidyltransferase [Patescibacteria group bacterium]